MVRNCVHTVCSEVDVSSMHAREQAVLLLKSMGTCERTSLGSVPRYQAFMVELKRDVFFLSVSSLGVVKSMMQISLSLSLVACFIHTGMRSLP